LVYPLGAGRSPTDEFERKIEHDTVYLRPLNAICCIPLWSALMAFYSLTGFPRDRSLFAIAL
ncbi:hypothetical protein, partial [Parabacteroides distasonis]|uniref:hypothetical protein n=1 Tax=Parabacteroides distasonis TaxID=823 RepID=UPI001E5F9465